MACLASLLGEPTIESKYALSTVQVEPEQLTLSADLGVPPDGDAGLPPDFGPGLDPGSGLGADFETYCLVS